MDLKLFWERHPGVPSQNLCDAIAAFALSRRNMDVQDDPSIVVSTLSNDESCSPKDGKVNIANSL